MPERTLRKSMLKAFGIFCFVLLVVSVLAFIYLPEYTHIRELQRRKEEVKNEIRVLEQRVKDLSLKNKLAKDKDPYFLEKLAREHLGVVKENEAVVDFTTH